MNKISLVLVSAILCSSPARSETSVKSLALRECVERALVNNLEIRAERINPGI